ncbi:plasmid stabilization system [Caldicellulosiruptor acetigenus I77R1B]|uniref:Plasmid stabilization system n=1 Tax=Caldicellulosiruptor acetigenus (strain ATCC 700853 / DSM 12137 / I77R1B) TaxID=632335 RepID=E4S6U0_CALA7|nr:type II toxin-antitoxin system RelE/ParE family toxin [Caldicellulosiruptor acetigenus]ADQ41723.1 plasmid stabilization system [Caldicellulosiruptor acetigenus I77R1B]WAM36698.1 type II toxin-antitoxin system RelE/ParE family toxin [Caldicellulosiruptor acetigenus]
MKIIFSKQALKFLSLQDAKTAKRIIDAIENNLSEKPFKGDIKVLKGREELRLRVGNIRVIFTVKGNEVHILTIGYRGDVYK